MSEEENDSGGEGLGSLPDDILDERKERPYRRRNIGEGVASGRAASNAMHSNSEQLKSEAHAAGIMGPADYKSDVQSTFQVRPVNAVDTLFGGIIELRVPA